MASNNDSFAEIKHLSKAQTFIGAASWKYVREGVILINKKDEIATFGCIMYANPHYELGQVLKMGDWHFTIERKNAKGRLVFPDKNDPTVYVLVAFHKNEHYNFGLVIPNNSDTLNTFTSLVLSTIGPILSPEIAQPLMDESNDVKIEWKRDSPTEISLGGL